MTKEIIKCGFFKIREPIVKGLKILTRVSIVTMRVAVVLAFIITPFLQGKISDVIAKFIWYPSCLLFVVFGIVTIFKKPKKPSKNPAFDFFANLMLVPVVVIFGSTFLINYYETAYTWWWAIFISVTLWLLSLVFCVPYFLKKKKGYTDEQQKASLKNWRKYLCFYGLLDLFYLTIFNYWIAEETTLSIWFILQFVFGGIAMVYLFYNLVRMFLSNVQKRWGGVLQDFFWGIAITVYLIYLIPDETLQTIVLTIIATVYGGFLTLVGVAWTIKETNEKRNEDLTRIENERKEEERKRNIPYVRISFEKEVPPLVANAYMSSFDFGNPDELALLDNKWFYKISIEDFIIKNLSQANIILNGVIAYGTYFEFSRKEIVEPGACCLVKTTSNHSYAVAHPEQSIFLVLRDILGNQYRAECHLASMSYGNSRKIIVTINGEEYTGMTMSYRIDSIDLPILNFCK